MNQNQCMGQARLAVMRIANSVLITFVNAAVEKKRISIRTGTVKILAETALDMGFRQTVLTAPIRDQPASGTIPIFN
jgi:hypothetical protein